MGPFARPERRQTISGGAPRGARAASGLSSSETRQVENDLCECVLKLDLDLNT